MSQTYMAHMESETESVKCESYFNLSVLLTLSRKQIILVEALFPIASDIRAMFIIISIFKNRI